MVGASYEIDRPLIASSMERNYISSFRILGNFNGFSFHEDATLTEFVSGHHVPWMNGVFRTDGNSPHLKELVSRTLSKYEPGCSMLWRVGALTNSADVVRTELQEQGLAFVGSESGLCLSLDNWQCRERDTDLKIELLRREEQIGDWLKPFADGFSIPETLAGHFGEFIKSRLGCSNDDEAWLIGYVDETPICSSYYFTNSDVTMLYNVATLTSHRSRGYGRRIVEETINHAIKRSSVPITLYSTEMGQALYKSMGFAPVYDLEAYLFVPN